MATGPWDPITADVIGRGRLRASDADREQVIDALKAAFVQGMLTKDELDLRAGRALASRTNAELAVITADIPASLIEIQPPSKPVQACAAKRVNKKVVVWGACVIVLPPALGTAFITYYGGFLVLFLFVFIGTVVSASPTAQRQLGRPSDLDLCTWSRSPNIPDKEAVTWSAPSRGSAGRRVESRRRGKRAGGGMDACFRRGCLSILVTCWSCGRIANAATGISVRHPRTCLSAVTSAPGAATARRTSCTGSVRTAAASSSGAPSARLTCS